jgi:hypothetical protein
MCDWINLLPGSHAGAIYRQVQAATHPATEANAPVANLCPTCDRLYPTPAAKRRRRAYV